MKMRVKSLVALFVVFVLACVNAQRNFRNRQPRGPRIANCVISGPNIQGVLTLMQNVSTYYLQNLMKIKNGAAQFFLKIF